MNNKYIYLIPIIGIILYISRLFSDKFAALVFKWSNTKWWLSAFLITQIGGVVWVVWLIWGK